jgi:hypothetical protein
VLPLVRFSWSHHPTMNTTEEQDPLETSTYVPDRVYFAIGSMLSAEDFQAEQSYNRGRLARALAYLHGAGTVSGLKVEYKGPKGAEERIEVQPGIAIDRLGRIIEVPREACLRLDRWYMAQNPGELQQAFHADKSGVIVDVFVRFMCCERGRAPAFASGPFDATDFTVPSRVRDAYKLELVLRKEGTPPLPEKLWPDLGADNDLAHRRAALHDAIFASWRGGTDQWDVQGLIPSAEHAVGQDTRSLFLARLIIPATPGSPPGRTEAPVTVDNDSRQFLYTPAALARWIGI